MDSGEKRTPYLNDLLEARGTSEDQVLILVQDRTQGPPELRGELSPAATQPVFG